MAIDMAVDSAVLNSKFIAIADKIREYTGDTAIMTEDEIPAKVDEVFAAGEKSEYDRFWDGYQINGERTLYSCAFGGSGWTDELFKPKYPIAPRNATYMFAYTYITDITDITKTDISFSQCVEFTNTFYGSARLEKVGVLDTTSSGATLSNTFRSASALKSIQGLILKDAGTQRFSGTFFGCSALEILPVSGTIGQNGFDVSDSPLLTHDSLLSIINALKDYSADTSGTVWTVTLGDENLAKLTEDEIAIAETKGWVLA